MKEAMLLRAYSPNVFLKGVNAAWAGETIDDCPFTFPAYQPPVIKSKLN
jgi:hypothetical protein